jgi:hypothetical protein
VTIVRRDSWPPTVALRAGPPTAHPGATPPNNTYPDEEHNTVADKSPRQHQSKKSGKSLKEKRTEKKGKQTTKRPGS